MTVGFKGLALNVLLAFLYVVLGRLTFAASVEYGNVTSVAFIPAGVALAFCILFGARVAPGIVLGQALLSYWSGPSLLGGLGIGLFNAFEAVLGGYLFHRWRLSYGFDRLRDVGLFAAMIFLILQPISATGGVLVLLASGIFPQAADLLGGLGTHGFQKSLQSLDSALSAWMHWWIGNSLGQLLFAPLLLVWLNPLKHKTAPMRWYELAVFAVGMGAVPFLAYSGLLSSPLLLLSVSYALLVWVGLRRGIRAVTLTNVMVAMIIVWVGAQGSGFMSDLSVPGRLFYVSFFLSTGMLFSLVLFAVFEERRDLIHQLTELACKDALTQVSNRRHFMEQSTRELTRAQRQGYPLSLALLDVDHFKLVNDQHGHPTGDQALQTLTHCCDKVLRTGDLVGRVGGEEFALLFPGINARDACQAVKRLSDVLAQHSILTPDGKELHITFSAGVVDAGSQATLDTMYREADQALYKAKHEGRNRVQIF